MMQLKDKVIFITGASRGIGEAIALKCAGHGASIVIASKTEKPHPKLPGTIYSVAEEVEKAGGKALPLFLDVRDDAAIEKAIQKTLEKFGRLDALINNASAISLTNTEYTEMKKFDLMFAVNVRATFACSKYAIPHLAKSDNPHILNISPPINLDPKWFMNHVAYTMSKYGMSMCTLGMADELRSQHIAVNSLWPQTTIATMAIKVMIGEEIYKTSRKPTIMADAAYEVLTSDSKTFTGNFLIDEPFLKTRGITDFTSYALDPHTPPHPDFFL